MGLRIESPVFTEVKPGFLIDGIVLVERISGVISKRGEEVITILGACHLIRGNIY
jgi:hypothetical protein